MLAYFDLVMVIGPFTVMGYMLQFGETEHKNTLLLLLLLPPPIPRAILLPVVWVDVYHSTQCLVELIILVSVPASPLPLPSLPTQCLVELLILVSWGPNMFVTCALWVSGLGADPKNHCRQLHHREKLQ